jgi:transcriptional regulator with XRE-family HTH domain
MAKQSSIEFGEKLKILRLHIHAKQSKIAAQLGISQQAYSYLENGKTHFTQTIIEKICVIFNISFQEFLMVDSQTQKQKFIAKINDADFDIYTARIMIANLKKQLIEKELRIVQLELALKTLPKKHISNSNVKPIYVLI